MDVRNFTFMFYGFSAAWIILVVYVVMIVAREKRLGDQLRRLRSMVEK